MKYNFILFIFTTFLFSCSSLKDLELKDAKDFSVKKLDPKGMESSIDLAILNPNNFRFKLLPCEFDIHYSGIYLGKARLTNKVKIKAGEERYYTFELRNDFSKVNFLEMLNLVRPGKFKNEIQIKGELKAGKLFFRKKFKIDYKEKVQLN